MRLLIALTFVFAQGLGSPFVDATATATPRVGGVDVELEVTVNAPVETVIAHISIPGETQLTVALNDRGDGVHGGLAAIPAADAVVVFEVLDPDRQVLSRPVTLTELGVSPEVLRTGRSFAIDEDSIEVRPRVDRRPLWLALGFGAAALALLAWWAAGDRKAPDAAPDAD